MEQRRSFLDRFRFKSTSHHQIAGLKKELDLLREELEDVKFEEYLLGAKEAYHAKGFEDVFGFSGSQSLNVLGSFQHELDIGTLQRLSTSEGFFYIAVNTIAQTISSLPHKVERKSVTFEKVEIEGTNFSIAKENWIDASGEPEQIIFKYPNDLQTAAEFYWTLGFDLLGTGNCYIYVDAGSEAREVKCRSFHLNDWLRTEKRFKSSGLINSPLLGQIQAPRSSVQGLYRINPAFVDPIISKEAPGLQGYGIQTPYGYFRFSTDEIIHLKLPNPADSNVGLAPIVPVLRNVMLERFSSEHVLRLYKNRALLGGILKTDKKLSKDQLTRMQRSFEQDFTGKGNAGRTVVLPDGMDYIPIEAKPSELGLIDFIKANREPILAAYKVPPIMIGLLDGATYANALIQRQTYFENAIKPILSIIEQGLNRNRLLMPPERNLRVRFDLSVVEALQENEKDKAETARLQLESGLTINEVRQRVWKLPPLEGGELSPVVAKTQAQGFGAQGGAIPFEAPQLAAGAEVQVPEAQPPSAPPSALNGPQVSSILEILSRVASGQLPRDSGIGILINGFGLSEGSANAVMGEVGRSFILVAEDPLKAKTDLPNAQPDAALRDDIRPTNVSFEERVSQLIAIAVNDGLSIDQAVRIAFERAYLEGFTPTPSEAKGDSQEESKDKEEEIAPVAPKPSHKFSDEQLIAFWKTLSGNDVEKYVEERTSEVLDFFSRLKSVFQKSLQKKLRASWINATLKAEDSDDFVDDDEIAKFIKEEQKRKSNAIGKATEHGFKQNLVQINLKYPDKRAAEALSKLGARNIKYVTETTRDRIRNILSQGVDEGSTIGEMSKQITEYFGEQAQSRARTIGRTETLTAISLGQDIKNQEFKKEYPDQAGKLMKVWITSRDERVRGNPDGLYPGKKGDPDHWDLESDSISEGDKFKNGLRFPRDPDGPPEEVINCRCAWLSFVSDDEKEILEQLEESPFSEIDNP